jgi:hypothetical protein
MDCVTMVLVERETGLPLDLVVLINSFLYERLTDENFKQAIALWFENKEERKWNLSCQMIAHHIHREKKIPSNTSKTNFFLYETRYET